MKRLSIQRTVSWFLIATIGLLHAGCQVSTTFLMNTETQNADEILPHFAKMGGRASEENRYEVAGIDNPAEFEAAFKKIQQLVGRGDKEAVSHFVQYPLPVYDEEKRTLIENRNQFLQEYDKIFTQRVKHALLTQKVEETFVNYQGVMVGNGEVWFGASDSIPQIYFIKAVNR